MGSSTNTATVIIVCIGLVLLSAVIAFPGQGMIAVGVLMIIGGGVGIVKPPNAMTEISSMILFVGGGLTVGIGLAVIQLQEIRRILAPKASAPPPQPDKSAEWVDPWKPSREQPTEPAPGRNPG